MVFRVDQSAWNTAAKQSWKDEGGDNVHCRLECTLTDQQVSTPFIVAPQQREDPLPAFAKEPSPDEDCGPYISPEEIPGSGYLAYQPPNGSVPKYPTLDRIDISRIFIENPAIR